MSWIAGLWQSEQLERQELPVSVLDAGSLRSKGHRVVSQGWERKSVLCVSPKTIFGVLWFVETVP